MRGKRKRLISRVDRIRIIPAHAGQTEARGLLRQIRSDHPRACGANVTLDGLIIVPGGSSPRMRGKLLFLTFRFVLVRIIPAHAGQTPCSR